MSQPKDADARQYYRVAIQRLEESELIHAELGFHATSIYLAGYAVECMLKAVLLELTPIRARAAMLGTLRSEIGHNLGKLRMEITKRRIVLPRHVAETLLFASSWSPGMRYEPGSGDPSEARNFINAAKEVISWGERRF